MSQDYNATLNLPKTDFPMRAGLPKSEPVTLKNWEDEKLYDKLMEHNEGKPLFVLHDGPPYANGDIHLGHALNKMLRMFPAGIPTVCPPSLKPDRRRVSEAPRIFPWLSCASSARSL